jgi:hypothetical protein
MTSSCRPRTAACGGPRVTRRALCQHRLYGLEERHVVANAQRVVMRHGQGECLRQLAHGVEETILAILLAQDVLLCRWKYAQPLLRRPCCPCRPVEAMEEAAADFVLLQHQGATRFLAAAAGEEIRFPPLRPWRSNPHDLPLTSLRPAYETGGRLLTKPRKRRRPWVGGVARV